MKTAIPSHLLNLEMSDLDIVSNLQSQNSSISVQL